MRRLALLLILMLIFVLPSIAQDNEQTAYEIALERIEEARVSGATFLELGGLGLTELPPELWELTDLQTLTLQKII